MLRASHICVDHTSRDVCVMFACIACGRLVDAEMYRFTHGNAEIWNFFWSVQSLTRELQFHICKNTNPAERVSAHYEFSSQICVDHVPGGGT